jgi:membrane associated rhomboid family serine protease
VLLIPIGQKDNVVQRLPWVSFALIGLCVLVFAALSAGGAEDDADRRLDAYLDYLGERPWLEPSPEVRQRLGPAFDDALAGARRRFEEAGGKPAEAAGGPMQQSLDALGQEVLAALEALPSSRFGFVPARPSPLTALSSQFLHGGWLHLLGNMLFLFVTAPFLEDVWGRPLFAAFYLAAGVVAAYTHGFASPHSLAPLIGASGAIAGVMGAFLVRFGSRRMEFLWLPIPPLFFIRRRIVLPAFVFLPMWLVEQLLYARSARGSGVAWWAHVGGFAFGFAVALLLRLARVEERYIAPGIQKQIAIEQHPSLDAALEARLRGDAATARREVRRALAAQPASLDAWREAWELALATNDGQEAARAGCRYLELCVRQREGTLAHEIVYDRRWRELARIPARLWLAFGGLCEREGDGRSALDCYEQAEASEPGDPATLRALLRRAELLRRNGMTSEARAVLARARSHPACRDAWPATVEAALAALDAPAPLSPRHPAPRPTAASLDRSPSTSKGGR